MLSQVDDDVRRASRARLTEEAIAIDNSDELVAVDGIVKVVVDVLPDSMLDRERRGGKSAKLGLGDDRRVDDERQLVDVNRAGAIGEEPNTVEHLDDLFGRDEPVLGVIDVEPKVHGAGVNESAQLLAAHSSCRCLKTLAVDADRDLVGGGHVSSLLGLERVWVDSFTLW